MPPPPAYWVCRTIEVARVIARRVLLAVVGALLGLGLGLTLRQGAPLQAKAAPSLTIALTSNTKGVLESCGCGAIKFGGVPERAQMIVDLRRQLGSSLLVVDSGDTFCFGDGPQKDSAMAQALVLSGCQAVNFGDEEAAIGLQILRQAAPASQFPWVATNLLDEATGKPPFPTSRVIAAGPVKVGVMGVLPPDWRASRPSSGPDDLLVTDPVAAVAREAAALRGKCQVLLLLAHTSQRLARQIVDAVPGITLVAGGEIITNVPHAGPFGGSYFAQGEGYSRNLMLVTLHPVGGAWRVAAATTRRNVYKSKRYPPVAKVAQKYVVTSSKALEELISRTYGKSPLYEGDEKCLSCHPLQHAHWKTTRHPQAWETLKQAGHRYDPDCLGCHTTGEPGKPSVALKGVQCEACHGPFAQHSKFPQTRPPSDEAWAKVCTTCHNQQRSPTFSIGEYLPQVKHQAPAPPPAEAPAAPAPSSSP